MAKDQLLFGIYKLSTNLLQQKTAFPCPCIGFRDEASLKDFCRSTNVST